jgi:hypothetical protein
VEAGVESQAGVAVKAKAKSGIVVEDGGVTDATDLISIYRANSVF